MVHIVEKHGPTDTFTAAHTRGRDPSQLVHIYDHGRWTTVGVPKTHPDSEATMRFFHAWFDCLDSSKSSNVFQQYLAVLRSAVDKTHTLSLRRTTLAEQYPIRPGLLSPLVIPTGSLLPRDRQTFVFGRASRLHHKLVTNWIYNQCFASPPDQGPLKNPAMVLRMSDVAPQIEVITDNTNDDEVVPMPTNP